MQLILEFTIEPNAISLTRVGSEASSVHPAGQLLDLEGDVDQATHKKRHACGTERFWHLPIGSTCPWCGNKVS